MELLLLLHLLYDIGEFYCIERIKFAGLTIHLDVIFFSFKSKNHFEICSAFETSFKLLHYFTRETLDGYLTPAKVLKDFKVQKENYQ